VVGTHAQLGPSIRSLVQAVFKGLGILHLNKTHAPPVFGCLCPNRLDWKTPADRNFSTTVQFKLDENQQLRCSNVDPTHQQQR
jgi:hypothetical protein